MSFFTFHKSDRRAILVMATLATVMVGIMQFVDMPELHFDERKPSKSSNSQKSRQHKDSTYHTANRTYDNSKRHISVGAVISESEADSLRRLYGEARDTGVRVSHKFQTLTLVDVNTADSTLLCRIPGIGAKTASRIIKLRERLGGFYNVNQLMGVYKFNPELLNWFKVSDSSAIRALNINTATFREINAHPYISYEQTRALMNHRQMYGPFGDMSALQSSGIFSPDELERLKPYLRL